MKIKEINKAEMPSVYIHFMNSLESAYSLEESSHGEIKGKGILEYELDSLIKFIFSKTERDSELRSKLLELHRLFIIAERMGEFKNAKLFTSTDNNFEYSRILNSGKHMLEKMQSSITKAESLHDL